jgi:hypothetical protein
VVIFGLVKFPVNEALTGMFSNLAASVGDNFAINELACSKILNRHIKFDVIIHALVKTMFPDSRFDIFIIDVKGFTLTIPS